MDSGRWIPVETIGSINSESLFTLARIIVILHFKSLRSMSTCQQDNGSLNNLVSPRLCTFAAGQMGPWFYYPFFTQNIYSICYTFSSGHMRKSFRLKVISDSFYIFGVCSIFCTNCCLPRAGAKEMYSNVLNEYILFGISEVDLLRNS